MRCRARRDTLRHVLTSLLTILIEFSGAEPLRVAVAASLKDAVTELASQFEKATGTRVEPLVGSSGQLASQVRYGAPIDVIISAADEPLAKLEHDKLLVVGSVRPIASNRLVLVAPGESKAELRGFRDLPRDTVRRIAIGDPAVVPAGQYATQVFESLGLADALRERIVHAANVRQVLAYVERGEVDAGVVYATDARISAGRVRVVEMADPAWHQPIRYSAAIVERSPQRDAARALVEFLAADEAQGVLERHGFLTLSQPTASPVAAASAPAREVDRPSSQSNPGRTPASSPASRPAAGISPAAAPRPARGPERSP